MALPPIFEWDESKNLENQCKHGVSFEEAQLVFLDPHRLLIADLQHSQNERRFYCVGRSSTSSGVITVRFTYRLLSIRIIGAGYWRRGKDFMSKKIMSKNIKYSDEPMGKLKIVPDFLPPPEVLAKRLRQPNTKVTIALSTESIGYFKSQAAKHHVQYQKLIRQVLDEYVAHQKQA